MQNHRQFPSYPVPLFQIESLCKTDFDLHKNEPVGGIHFLNEDSL